MAHRRENPQSPSLPELPWSLGIVIASLIYAAVRLLAGYPGGGFFSLLTNVLRTNAGLVLLIIGACAIGRSLQLARRPTRRPEVDLAAIRALSWPEFRALCGDALSINGFHVQADEVPRTLQQVDLILRRGQESMLVYCSRWRSLNVRVKEVRELYDAVIGHHAAGGIFVTSGYFSGSAISYARGKPLELIDGDRLAQLLAELRQRRLERRDGNALIRPSSQVEPNPGRSRDDRGTR